MNKIILIIIGMTLVTYIPRLLPFYIIGNRELPHKFEKFLRCIPYAALGALIIPGIFQSIPDNPTAAFIGFIVAVALSWFKGGIIIPVMGSVVSVMLVLLI
ncbi:MAG: AzlD domain-containing protein [Firmicutes bacterium]|jgi:branched-subunit amino acid transport protein|nr:AzlD domain-containing protein [Bacillota bacterium]